jgi:hypothetical protein
MMPPLPTLPVSLSLKPSTQSYHQDAQKVAALLRTAQTQRAGLGALHDKLLHEQQLLQARQDAVRKLTFGLLKPHRKQLAELAKAQQQVRKLQQTGALLKLQVQPTDDLEDRWLSVEEAYQHLGACQKVWQVAAEEGAMAKTLDLLPCQPSLMPPPGFYLQPMPLGFTWEGGAVVFTPLGVLHQLTDGTFVWREPATLRVTVGEEPFRERAERAPTDAQVIFRTWEFVDKDGKPDPNFPAENNPAITVVRYGRLVLQLGNSGQLVFLVSNIGVARQFGQSLSAYYSGE